MVEECFLEVSEFGCREDARPKPSFFLVLKQIGAVVCSLNGRCRLISTLKSKMCHSIATNMFLSATFTLKATGLCVHFVSYFSVSLAIGICRRIGMFFSNYATIC